MRGRGLVLLLVALALVVVALLIGVWWGGPVADLQADGGVDASPASGESVELPPLPKADVDLDRVTPPPVAPVVFDPAAIRPSKEWPDPKLGTLKLNLSVEGHAKLKGRWLMTLCPHDPKQALDSMDKTDTTRKLGAGRWTLRIVSPLVSFTPFDTPFDIREGEVTTLDVVMTPRPLVQLTVVDQDGEPIDGLVVTLSVVFDPVAGRPRPKPRKGGRPGPGVINGFSGGWSSGGKGERPQLVKNWTMGEGGAVLTILPTHTGTLAVASGDDRPIELEVHLNGTVLHRETIPAGVRERRIVVTRPR